MIKIERIDQSNLMEAEDFLSKYEESSQFLINNLRIYGATLTDHHNSGNFKLMRKDGNVCGLFALLRRGNLLIQSTVNDPELILEACIRESLPIKGFIGDWESVEPVFRLYREKNPSYSPTFESKEVLFSYPLLNSDSKLVHDPRVRLLESSDFDQWLKFTNAYLAELGMPDGLSDEQKRQDFESQVVDKVWWGLFLGDELVSRVALNSKGKTVGQVGGVFTPKPHRQKGYVKATMFHMLKDCRDIHGHSKSILFTDEHGVARKLYESMGYKAIGYFALIF